MTAPLKVTPAQAKRLEKNLQRKPVSKKNKKEVVHMEVFMMLIKSDRLSCGDDPEIPHVWESSRIPPHDDDKCLCGEVTWTQDVERRRELFCQRQNK